MRVDGLNGVCRLLALCKSRRGCGFLRMREEKVGCGRPAGGRGGSGGGVQWCVVGLELISVPTDFRRVVFLWFLNVTLQRQSRRNTMISKLQS